MSQKIIVVVLGGRVDAIYSTSPTLKAEVLDFDVAKEEGKEDLMEEKLEEVQENMMVEIY